MSVVAKYVIGLAAAMSGDLRYSEALMVEVCNTLPQRDSQLDVFRHIREQAPQWLTQIYAAQSVPLYNAWLVSRDSGLLQELRELVTKVEAVSCDRQPFLPLMALCAFVHERDVKRAIALLRESKEPDTPVMLINLGFLEAYSGDLRRPSQLYRRHSKGA